jgi:hypothetical protein
MATSDLRTYVEELLRSMDPEVDLSPGSPAQTKFIDPLLARIGPDPYDMPMQSFIQTRIRQSSDLGIQEIDELNDVLIEPMRLLLEPIVREQKLARIRSDVRNYEQMAEDELDALLANVFETRQAGGFATGVIRFYYTSAQSASFNQPNIAISKGGLRFIPTVPQAITVDEMLLNREGSEFYVDINYIAESRGDEYNIDVDQIASVANVPAASRAKNLRRFRDGKPRETNAAFYARAAQGLGDKTMTTERGIARLLGENFPEMRRLFVVGYKDPEMVRDIITGGSFNPVQSDDAYGSYFGTGSTVDDLSDALTTSLVTVTGAALVSRIGPIGSDPLSWYLCLTYTDPSTSALRAVDARIVEIRGEESAILDVRLPYSLTVPVSLVWVLRKNELTISDIPGGIVLPTSPDGTTIEILPGEVHVGGRADVYVAGAVTETTTQLTSITDEEPLLQGVSAETQASIDPLVVLIHDVTTAQQESVAANPDLLSLVLESGVDAGAYRILRATVGASLSLLLATPVAGNQLNLRWRIIDSIQVNLTDPKTIKITGSDLVLAGGDPNVYSVGGTNWIDADVRHGDRVRVTDTVLGLFSAEYTVDTVGPTVFTVTPSPGRTFSSIAYTIFTPSAGVETPLVRIKKLELADSAGAGSGTSIPYRDPVLALSSSFQNEGAGYSYDGLGVLGLVSSGIDPANTFAVGSQTIDWQVCLPEAAWQYTDSGTITFSAGSKTAAQVAAEINASTLAPYARAVTETVNGKIYVGITSAYLVIFTDGTALTDLGLGRGYTNSSIRSVGASRLSLHSRTARGDCIETLGSRNAGKWGRLVNLGPGFLDLVTGVSDVGFRVGMGAYGPLDTINSYAGLYYPTIYLPEIDVQMRIGRPAVGAARTYFLAPTSMEADSIETTYTQRGVTSGSVYVPDPENTRQLLPYVGTTDLPGTTASTGVGTRIFTDPSGQFLMDRIKPGDLLVVLYRSIRGASVFGPGSLGVTGVQLSIRIGTYPAVLIQFPYDMTLAQCVEYINAQLAESVASVDGNRLRLDSNQDLVLDTSVTSGTVFFGITTYTNAHVDNGRYVIAGVEATALEISNRQAPFTGDTSALSCRYQILRHMQRVSSTEMNLQVDASGLYYADVSLLSRVPGDASNLTGSIEMDVAGHRADGYRLRTSNAALTYSRAEEVFAELSPTMLVVGSLDAPSEATQLSRQNVLATYDRSQLVDEVQNFCDSTFNRVVTADLLARHLLPNYVSTTIYYVGGIGEAQMRTDFESLLDGVEPGDELEVSAVTTRMVRRGASSVYTPDAASPSGRSAPVLVVVYHEVDRKIYASFVRDRVSTTRTRRFMPDNVQLRRVTSSGIR